MTTERQILLREFRPNSIRIKLHSEIGNGLSANVYRGVREDSRGLTRQHVAVKISKTASEAEMLRREFETLLKVQSQNLVRVYAWDDHGDESMLSMEFIDGVSLCDVLQSELLDQTVIEEILTQVQDGLKDLAKEGLEHGDLSPANILIDRIGMVKLIDLANPDRSSGYMHGTPPYMAPEVWSGHPCTIASDLFSLGLLELDLKQKFSDRKFHPPVGASASKSRCFLTAQANPDHPWLANFPSARHFTDRSSSLAARKRLSEIVDLLQSATQSTVKAAAQSATPSVTRAHEELSCEITSTDILVSGDRARTHQIMQKNIQETREYRRKKGGKSPLHRARWITLGLVFLAITCGSDQNEARLTSTLRASLPANSSALARIRTSALPTSLRSPLSRPPVLIAKADASSLQICSHRWMSVQIDGKSLGYTPVKLEHLKPGKYLLKWATSAASGVKFIEIHAKERLKLRGDDFSSN